MPQSLITDITSSEYIFFKTAPGTTHSLATLLLIKIIWKQKPRSILDVATARKYSQSAWITSISPEEVAEQETDGYVAVDTANATKNHTHAHFVTKDLASKRTVIGIDRLTGFGNPDGTSGAKSRDAIFVERVVKTTYGNTFKPSTKVRSMLHWTKLFEDITKNLQGKDKLFKMSRD